MTENTGELTTHLTTGAVIVYAIEWAKRSHLIPLNANTKTLNRAVSAVLALVAAVGRDAEPTAFLLADHRAIRRYGLGFEDLKKINPAIVFMTISGYGMTGPYKDMPSHGIAYDVWAGLVGPEITEDGFCAIPEHPSMGIHAGPLFGALGVLAGVIKARATGEGCRLEIAQSDAAAAMLIASSSPANCTTAQGITRGCSPRSRRSGRRCWAR